MPPTTTASAKAAEPGDHGEWNQQTVLEPEHKLPDPRDPRDPPPLRKNQLPQRIAPPEAAHAHAGAQAIGSSRSGRPHAYPPRPAPGEEIGAYTDFAASKTPTTRDRPRSSTPLMGRRNCVGIDPLVFESGTHAVITLAVASR